MTDKLPVFARNGDRNTTGLNPEDGFPQGQKPARQWFNWLFYTTSSAINSLVDDIKRQAPLDSPSFTGSPQVPLPGMNDSSGTIAPTGWIRKLFAPLQTPTFLRQGGSEGGEIHLEKPDTNTTLTSDVIVDVNEDYLRFFAWVNGTLRGSYLYLPGLRAGIGSRLATFDDIGSLRSFKYSGANDIQLNPDDAGCGIQLGTPGKTAYLPPGGTVPEGRLFWFFNNAGGTAYVAVNQSTSGMDFIFNGLSMAQKKVQLHANQSLILMARGGSEYDVIGGSAASQFSDDQTSQIAFFAGPQAPIGWLKANGAAVSRTAYASLFERIGTTYGTGDGSTTFNLPDLRGEFVRGWDDGRGIDGGRTLGSKSAATTIRDRVGANPYTGYVLDIQNAPYSIEDPAATPWAESGLPAGSSASTVGESRVYSVSPRNIALLACIKY